MGRDLAAGRKVSVSVNLVGYIVSDGDQVMCRKIALSLAMQCACLGEPDLSDFDTRVAELKRLRPSRVKPKRVKPKKVRPKKVKPEVPSRFERAEPV